MNRAAEHHPVRRIQQGRCPVDSVLIDTSAGFAAVAAAGAAAIVFPAYMKNFGLDPFLLQGLGHPLQSGIGTAPGCGASVELAVQQANADAIRLLNEAMPSDKVLALKSLEALEKVADGKATKLIIPSNLQNLAGTVASIQELLSGSGS